MQRPAQDADSVRGGGTHEEGGPFGRVAGHGVVRRRRTAVRRARREGRHGAAPELRARPHVPFRRRAVHDEQPVARRRPSGLDRCVRRRGVHPLCALLRVARPLPGALRAPQRACHLVQLHGGGVRHHARQARVGRRVVRARRPRAQPLRAAHVGRVVRGRRGTRNRRERPHRHRGLRDDVALHLPAVRPAAHPPHGGGGRGGGAHGRRVQVGGSRGSRRSPRRACGCRGRTCRGGAARARHAHHDDPNHKRPAATATTAHAPTGEKGGPQ